MGSWAYDKENTRQVRCKLNRRTDADIIERLEREENMQSYIKRLIREDIAREERRATPADHSEEASRG